MPFNPKQKYTKNSCTGGNGALISQQKLLNHIHYIYIYIYICTFFFFIIINKPHTLLYKSNILLELSWIPNRDCLTRSDPIYIMKESFLPFSSLTKKNNTEFLFFKIKVKNIDFDVYIGIRILWIYRIYIDVYFYMNIDILKINKNTLKFLEILYKSVKIALIIKYTY